MACDIHVDFWSVLWFAKLSLISRDAKSKQYLWIDQLGRSSSGTRLKFKRSFPDMTHIICVIMIDLAEIQSRKV